MAISVPVLNAFLSALFIVSVSVTLVNFQTPFLYDIWVIPFMQYLLNFVPYKKYYSSKHFCNSVNQNPRHIFFNSPLCSLNCYISLKELIQFPPLKIVRLIFYTIC